MLRKSISVVSARTLDYLARKHPWFDAILRNRWLAFVVLIGYTAVVVVMGWYVHNGNEGGWKEVVKSYSPLFFDLLVIFLFSVIFLLARGYFIEEKSRVDINELPDRDLFLRFRPSSVILSIDDVDFFQRHVAISAILDALPIDQSDFFLAHAGSLDIPKITLKSIEITSEKTISLTLGVGAFKEFFFTHHFADYSLSRSSSGDSGRKETLRRLFSPIYFRAYIDFFKGRGKNLDFLSYTPNTLGLTGCIEVICGENKIFFLQHRGHHESAARGVLHLSYAGTISAYPNFIGESLELSLDDLADDEFEDEFMQAEPGLLIKSYGNGHVVVHEMVGICANSQYLFQPEIFVLTKITVENKDLIVILLEKFSPAKRKKFLAIESLEEINQHLSRNNWKLRPLCQAAIEKIYVPHLHS